MTNKDLESITFHISCKGRNNDRKEVLEQPIDVQVNAVKRPDSNNIGITPECIYIGGGHSQYCSASGDKKVLCPYSIDIPYAIDE